MADKAITELVAAEQITATDLFVLEQNGTAKKLTGQILLNWLTKAADGHGGIASITKHSTSGLADTYRITLADTTTFDFVVTNGNGISSITKTSSAGLVDTYTIQYTDGSSGTFTVTNGAKGDKGDNAYIWIKYASQEPTENSHSFGDIPDAWMGVYFGILASAPTDWQQYKWFKIKGEQGDTGDPAVLKSSTVHYQAGDSGTVIPSGVWSETVPAVAQGKYLWTRIVQTFNTGEPITFYSVSRMGMDGTGAVSMVCGVSPGSDGNVVLDASSVGALSTKGGTMEGPVNMDGQKLNGLNAPTENTEAVNKKYVDDSFVKKTGDTMTGPLTVPAPEEGGHAANKEYVDGKFITTAVVLSASGWAENLQTVAVGGVTADPNATDEFASPDPGDENYTAYIDSGIRLYAQLDGAVTFKCVDAPSVDITVYVAVRK